MRLPEAFDPDVQAALSKFVNHANTQVPQRMDIALFNRFILHSHAVGQKVTDEEMCEGLKSDGFPSDYAEALSEHYDMSFDLLDQAQGAMDWVDE